jgi:hypothetical protein
MGVTGAVLIGLFFVSRMLLASQAANGALTQGIEDARGINARQVLAIDAIRENHDNLLVQVERERARTAEANLALDQVNSDLVTERKDFKRRLNDALDQLTDEELYCAAEFVPQPIIDSLCCDTETSSPF